MSRNVLPRQKRHGNDISIDGRKEKIDDMHLLGSMLTNTASLVYDIVVGEDTTDRLVHLSRSISWTMKFFNSTKSHKHQGKNYNSMTKDEILYDVAEVVSKIVNYFLSIDPQLIEDLSPTVDYSLGSHEEDREHYANVIHGKKVRAKALYDFVKYEEHELGFVKNNIITLLNCKDEHCWIGELNGKIGWFPARFVEILDERTKSYSCAGDDNVSKIISPMIRDNLCPIIEQLLRYGMKKKFLRNRHPWYFIKEVALRIANDNYGAIFSRLVLCKTYKLEEKGKVLTPEEILFRCIHLVELTHGHVGADVKFRSLISLGLNEQVLHLWLEVLCSCEEVIEDWYHETSFIRSPGWVQIKCDLRVLARLPFNLNYNWELPTKDNKEGILKNNIRDMLLKYHLFSWDI